MYQQYDRKTIREEPVPRKTEPVIDAERLQKNRFRIRDEK